tara:strand:- start:145 stop:693 length:549 start_codon:yes stop_codon:yes gene_type:complete
MINIIVACNRRGGIGIKNDIPWKLRSDMLRFKSLTEGNGNNSVIMGKNTWNSLPKKYRPLSNRKNIILSSTLTDKEVDDKDIYIARTIDEAIDYCNYKKFSTNWVIGGSMLYAAFLDTQKVDKIYKTEIDIDCKCDTFFPRYDEYIVNHSSEKLSENNINFIYKTYVKDVNTLLMRAHTGMF